MSSYWRSRYPTISPKLLGRSVFVGGVGKAAKFNVPCFVVNLVSETGGINDGEGDAGAFVVQFQLFSRSH